MLEHLSSSPSAAAASCWRLGGDGRCSRLVVAAATCRSTPSPTSPTRRSSILTSAPGLSPLEVEQYLTYPDRDRDERPAAASTRSARSAAPRVSAVTVVFQDGTDVWFARQLVSERLKLAEADIPPGYGRPELAPVSTGLGEIYEFYLASKTHTPMELRTLLDWVVALQAALGARRHRGQRHGRRGQAVPGRPRPASGWPATACRWATVHEHPRAQQRLDRRRLHREEPRVVRHPRRRAVPQHRGHREHRRHRPTPTARRCCSSTSREVRIGPALRFGVVTKHGEGEIVAGTVMMLIGANSREVVHARQGAARRDPEGAARRASRSGPTTTAPSSSTAC